MIQVMKHLKLYVLALISSKVLYKGSGGCLNCSSRFAVSWSLLGAEDFLPVEISSLVEG